MKRSLVAILAIIYITISSGVIVNIHYCMGKVSGVDIGTLAEKKCGCGKMASKGCCKSEFKVVKLEDAQKASYAGFIIHTPVTPLVTELNTFQVSSFNACNILHANIHSPPLISRQDTYLQNCVFRI